LSLFAIKVGPRLRVNSLASTHDDPFEAIAKAEALRAIQLQRIEPASG